LESKTGGLTELGTGTQETETEVEGGGLDWKRGTAVGTVDRELRLRDQERATLERRPLASLAKDDRDDSGEANGDVEEMSSSCTASSLPIALRDERVLERVEGGVIERGKKQQEKKVEPDDFSLSKKKWNTV
jgi:hypothetical protein